MRNSLSRLKVPNECRVNKQSHVDENILIIITHTYAMEKNSVSRQLLTLTFRFILEKKIRLLIWVGNHHPT